jgi:hypothetical protein
MSSRGRSTRAKKVTEPAPPILSQTPVRPRPRASRQPPVLDEREQLTAAYLQLYDKAEAFKNDLVAAEGRRIVSTGQIFTAAMVSFHLFPLYTCLFVIGEYREHCRADGGPFSV